MIGQLVTASAGGQWPRQRQRERGYLVLLKCPRCGAPEETLFDRIRGGPCNADDPAYVKSEHLVSQARVGHEANP
eukprot:3662493-Pyramimonas_sp.AAC.1